MEGAGHVYLANLGEAYVQQWTLNDDDIDYDFSWKYRVISFSFFNFTSFVCNKIKVNLAYDTNYDECGVYLL